MILPPNYKCRTGSKQGPKVDPWGREKQETQRAFAFNLFWAASGDETWGFSPWLVRRYLQDNHVEEWNYTAHTSCFCKASWELIGRKIRTDRRDRQRGPRGGFDKVEVKAFSSSLFLPFCLLNGSLGGLRSAGVRTKSRPKKGPTYPDKR